MEEVRLKISEVWAARKVEGRGSRRCTNKMNKGRVQSPNKILYVGCNWSNTQLGLLKIPTVQRRKAKQKPNKTALQVVVAEKNF